VIRRFLTLLLAFAMLHLNVERADAAPKVAWVTSTSVTQGELRGRAINSAGAELVVLTGGRTAGGSAPFTVIARTASVTAPH